MKNFLNLETKLTLNQETTDSPNLVGRFSLKDLEAIGEVVWDGFDRDLKSRAPWEKRMEAGLNLAMQVAKDKNFPWPGASNVIFPLVTIASLQFSARSYENIVQGTDVVRYRKVGQDLTGLVTQRADRISKHMSWQVLEEDDAWEEQHDRLLINLGIVGSNFVKTRFNSRLGHNVSELVMARDFVLDYYAPSVAAAARKTHIVPLYRNEIYERVRRGVFADCLAEEWFTQIPSPPEPNYQQNQRSGLNPPQADEDTPFKTLEQHRLLDLDQDGYAEPYIVTIEESSKRVLRIVARWNSMSDIEYTAGGKVIQIKAMEYFTKFSFIPSPDGGIYDLGFGVLLGPLNESVNTGINQLLDAGTMANSNGGFLGRGAKIRGGNYTFAPWEWVRVDSTGDDLRKSLVQLPTREPSAVMFNLLGLLIEYTDRIAGTTETMVGKNPGQNTPAETSRNMTEQGMKVYSAIFKRVWRSLKEEFKKLHQLNAMYLPLSMGFGEKSDFVRREDYLSNPDQVIPVANPNITSKSMRVTQAAMVREAAHQVPGYDVAKVEKRYLHAMDVEGIDDIYPGADKVPPLPNPKASLEQMKLQGKAMEIEFKKWQFIQQLQEDRKKVSAEISLMQAQVAEILSDIHIDHADNRLKAFETVVKALETHEKLLNDRIQTLSGLGGKDGDSESDGVGPVADKPGNPGLQGVSQNMAPGANGAMGSGTIQ